MIKQYLVDNFHLSAGNLRTVGYGKTRPKNSWDLNAPENRRVEVVNLAAQVQASKVAPSDCGTRPSLGRRPAGPRPHG